MLFSLSFLMRDSIGFKVYITPVVSYEMNLLSTEYEMILIAFLFGEVFTRSFISCKAKESHIT